MTLAEQILRALDANEGNETKLNSIKALAREEIRLQALKAVPAKAKLSTTLTKMYKDSAKVKNRYTGYINLDTGFAIIDGCYVVRVFDSSPADLLPNSAEKVKRLTAESVNRLFDNTNTDLQHDVTVSYSDVIEHIKVHGRSKKTLKNQIFSVSNNDFFVNVFYLEYAFKLAQTQELTFKVLDSERLLYVQREGWDMLICLIPISCL